jgi:protocatechuate 3,4-dioxygenase beta subunit
MSSRRIVPSLALGLLLVVAACSPSGSSGRPSAPSAAPATTTPSIAAASAGPVSPSASAVAAASASPGAAAAALACTAPASPTTAQTEGPYYTPGSPERADLVDEGMAGTVIVVSGSVVDPSCTPLANAKVEVWQADADGVYDNSGYRLRGYVLTDAQGRYTFRTVVPGEYPGRTEHIHVKVTPEGGRTLTTQLYFPGTAANEGDSIFSPDLLLDIAERGDGLVGTFTFVVEG